MTYQTTITRKGQLTLPKAIRDLLKLELGRRVLLVLERRGRLKITPLPLLSSLAGSFKVKKSHDPVAIRKHMEKSYRRT